MKKTGIARLAALALCLCLLLAGCGQELSAPPAAPQDSCVLDLADVLSKESENTINHYTAALQAASGGQIAVLTVPEPVQGKLSDYTAAVFKSWGIGSAKEKNGVLLVMEIGENPGYWCLQGSGLRRKLNDRELGQLLDRELVPSFAAGDYDTAATALVMALAQKTAAIYGAGLDLEKLGSVTLHPGRPDGGAGKLLLLAGAVVLILAVVAVCTFLLLRRQPQKPPQNKIVYHAPGSARAKKKGRSGR